ncbi:MAG: hypothetical protein HYX84_06130 [Chloroflexi bacterium]|nr:hypothetical protein [Chloroflexota bacterium]
MKKLITLTVVAVLVVGLVGATVAYGSGIRASKATAKVSELTLIDWQPAEPDPVNTDNIPAEDYASEWTTILTQNIKTPNQKDLFVGVSLETGLWTRTLVRSKATESEPLGDWDTSKARSRILVRVLVDGQMATTSLNVPQAGAAFPRAVTFNDREQTLSAKFMGIFTGDDLIVTEDPVTGEHTVTINYDTLDYEELDLILNTLTANSFNFVVADLTPGNHEIEVQAQIRANGSAENGSYQAMALVGQGSVVIESVRMMKGEDYLDVPE